MTVQAGADPRTSRIALQQIANRCKLGVGDVIRITLLGDGISQFQPIHFLRSEVMMKPSAWLCAAAMSVSSLALAQTASSSGVTEITDPAKIAEIQQHAQQLASRGQQTPAAGEGEHMHKRGMHHQKHKAMHHRGMKHKAKEKAAPDAPMATENKG